jgi:UTP:GlnB (protein PII) uridylyltransferase
VSQAIVSTVGDGVVDVFYLRDAHGQKFTDAETLDDLRARVLAHVTSAA